jgi:catechol 2,3-dioxygenase-like lactoylglutathione lyase family enzyme
MTVRRVVVDHVLLVVRELEVSRGFYCAALAPLGIEELDVKPDRVSFGAEGLDDFAIFAGSPAATAAHVAFDAPSRGAVDAFHAAALEHGGRADPPAQRRLLTLKQPTWSGGRRPAGPELSGRRIVGGQD